MNETDLAHRATITEIVRAYHDARDAIQECHARLSDAENALNARLAIGEGAGATIDLPRVTARHGSHENLATQLKHLRLAVWSHVVDRLGIWRLCSTKRAEQLHAQLDADPYRRRHYYAEPVEELPEITEENVIGMINGFAASIDTMMSESVREVFDMLRPRDGSGNGRYKRNGKEVVGAHATLSYAVEKKTFRPGFEVRYGYRDEIMALDNCFRMLDRKSGALKTHRSELDLAIEASIDGTGVTEYFQFRCYKNKSLHLKFLRPDLVAKLNAYAGGKNLRSAA